MEKVEEGLRDSADGKVSSNEDVKNLIDQWLK
jgi:predicted transcriptional regulator